MEEKNISLSKAIIDFVETWDLVLETKKEEYKKRARASQNDEEFCNPDEDVTKTNKPPAFDFINEWLDLDEHGELLPHLSKRSAYDKSPRKRHNIYPISADIIDYLCEYMPGRYTDESSILSSVNRSLPILVKKGKIQKAEDNTYRPTTIEYKRKTMIPLLALHAEIDEKQFFSVSANTYMVFYTTKYLEKEISFFKDFVGEQSLFDIFLYENRIVMLIKGNKEEAKKIGKTIRSAVREAYALQQQKRKEVAKTYKLQSK